MIGLFGYDMNGDSWIRDSDEDSSTDEDEGDTLVTTNASTSASTDEDEPEFLKETWWAPQFPQSLFSWREIARLWKRADLHGELEGPLHLSVMLLAVSMSFVADSRQMRCHCRRQRAQDGASDESSSEDVDMESRPEGDDSDDDDDGEGFPEIELTDTGKPNHHSSEVWSEEDDAGSRCADFNQFAISASFQLLPSKAQRFAHHYARAAWAAAPLSQSIAYTGNVAIHAFLMAVLRPEHGDQVDLDRLHKRSGVSQEVWDDFCDYMAILIGSRSAYSLSKRKYIPKITKHDMSRIAHASPSRRRASACLPAALDAMYDLSQPFIGFPADPARTSGLYFGSISKADTDLIGRFWLSLGRKATGLYQTTLAKDDDGDYEIRVSSIDVLEPESHLFENRTVRVTYGWNRDLLANVVAELQLAAPFADNEHTSKQTALTIEMLRTGKHIPAADNELCLDNGPVQASLGFDWFYGDPAATRSELSYLITIHDTTQSSKFDRLARESGSLFTALPWPRVYDAEKVAIPNFQVALTLAAGRSFPSGIAYEAFDDAGNIIATKQIELVSVTSARSAEPSNFLRKEEDALVRGPLAGDIMTVSLGVHELLGHCSGKQLLERVDGTMNFDPATTLDPRTGKPVTSWYKPGESYQTKFGGLGMTIEECRAELIALYLSTDVATMAALGFEGQRADDIAFGVHVFMMHTAIRSLTIYDPATKTIPQAHAAARFVILSHLVPTGFVTVDIRSPTDVKLVFDRTRMSAARGAVADLLTRIQVARSTGDVGFCDVWRNELMVVDETWHQAVLAVERTSRAGQRVHVQPNTFLRPDGTVEARDYPPTAQGMAQSVVDRFPDHESGEVEVSRALRALRAKDSQST
ncbi:bifunctional diacylglycerol diphosphate phosphatase/phosphatidate phosphatase [Thoreauomyces humboldtii]|nr:bifunctional diacylglycerol diphosphate phosphatase/phosphatidate phosphatase [Thoreauomyces humboldtii]